MWLALVIIALMALANESARLLAEKLLGLPVKLLRLTVAPGPRARRTAVALASIIASYLVVYGAAVYHHKTYGVHTGTSHVVIADVQPGFDAHGKLRVDDVIVALDDAPVYYRRHGQLQQPLIDRIQERVRAGAETVNVTVHRPAGADRGQQTYVIRPYIDYELPEQFLRLGVALRFRAERLPGSLSEALVFPYYLVKDALAPRKLPSSAELSGPVGISDNLEIVDNSGHELRTVIAQCTYFFLFLILPWFLLRLAVATLPTRSEDS